MPPGPDPADPIFFLRRVIEVDNGIDKGVGRPGSKEGARLLPGNVRRPGSELIHGDKHIFRIAGAIGREADDLIASSKA